ncbi:ATP-binding protein [Methanobrevibacter sp.]
MNSITLKPELTELHTLNEFILNELPQENIQVDLLVEEIFANIVNYSNSEFITVNVEYCEPTLVMEFIDNGTEFNPLLKKNPDTPQTIDDAQIGGLGIRFIKELSDEAYYHYENDENHLKIIKNVVK